MALEADTTNRSTRVLKLVEREMNFSYPYSDTTATEPGWYTCLYEGYTYGKTSCLEVEGCFPMTIFLQVLSMFGFVSNVTVFILICAVSHLHKPIYTGIRMLTIPDALFLSSRFLLYTFEHIPDGLKVTLIYLHFTSFISSINHVLLLSIQQYLMIAYPLKCLNWISNRRLLAASGVIWITSALGAFPFIYITFIVEKDQEAALLNIVYTALFTIGPICVLGVLHVMKIIALKRSLVNNSDKTTRRVSQIISIVVGVYILTTTPINVKDVLEMSFCPMIDTWYIVLGHIGRTLLLVNHSINPYIYFISTPQFRRTVSYCFNFGKHKNRVSKASSQIEQAQVISRRCPNEPYGNIFSVYSDTEISSISSQCGQNYSISSHL